MNNFREVLNCIALIKKQAALVLDHYRCANITEELEGLDLSEESGRAANIQKLEKLKTDIDERLLHLKSPSTASNVL